MAKKYFKFNVGKYKGKLRCTKKGCSLTAKKKPALPPIKAPDTGFWDTFDKEILRKKKR